jgi:hypothetical protein
MGKYPVDCAPVPEGAHVVGLESAGDCMGYLRVDVVFAPGEPVTIDLTR